MLRDLTEQLVAWKDQPTRKPLVIYGARQVGKTYLLNQFAQAHFKKYFLLDFNEERELKKIFELDQNPKRILQDLSIFFNDDIDPRKDLLIFDEIQFVD